MIGGASIYNEVIAGGLWDRIYLTKVASHFDCDTFFPSVDSVACREVTDPNVSSDEQTEGNIKYSFHVFERSA